MNVFSISEPVPVDRYIIPTGEEFTIYVHISFDYRISLKDMFAKLQDRGKSEFFSVSFDSSIEKCPKSKMLEALLDIEKSFSRRCYSILIKNLINT